MLNVHRRERDALLRVCTFARKTLIDSVAFSAQPFIFQRKFGPVAVAVTVGVCEIRIAICLQYVVRQVIDVYCSARICIVRS